MPNVNPDSVKFLVIGDSCQDIFCYGSASRLSPEAPVPVFTPHKTIRSKGMAGNVEANLAALIKFNADETAVMLNSLLSPSTESKTRYVDEKTNHYFLRVDRPDTFPPLHPHAHREEILAADCIIISDYDKGFIDDRFFYHLDIMQEARQVVICDTKKTITQDIVNACDFIKVNEKEFSLNRTILQKNLNKVIMTLGDRGAKYMDTEFNVTPVTTMDVSGAGDSFLAAFAFAYMKDQSVDIAIDYANYIASSIVKKRGVSTI